MGACGLRGGVGAGGGTAVEISPVGTALEAYTPVLEAGRSKASWVQVDAWPVLEAFEGERLEPGERAADDVLVMLPAAGSGRTEVRLILTIGSAQGTWERARVVSLGPTSDNED